MCAVAMQGRFFKSGQMLCICASVKSFVAIKYEVLVNIFINPLLEATYNEYAPSLCKASFFKVRQMLCICSSVKSFAVITMAIIIVIGFFWFKRR